MGGRDYDYENNGDGDDESQLPRPPDSESIYDTGSEATPTGDWPD